MSRAALLSVDEFLSGAFSGSGPFFIAYKTPREYRRLGKSIGLMLDIRVGLFSWIKKVGTKKMSDNLHFQVNRDSLKLWHDWHKR